MMKVRWKPDAALGALVLEPGSEEDLRVVLLYAPLCSFLSCWRTAPLKGSWGPGAPFSPFWSQWDVPCVGEAKGKQDPHLLFGSSPPPFAFISDCTWFLCLPTSQHEQSLTIVSKTLWGRHICSRQKKYFSILNPQSLCCIQIFCFCVIIFT